MKLFLLRHLPTRDNELNINGSRTNTPLSETGLKLAQDLITKLSVNKYDLFIVSPLQRTQQTIQPFLDTLENPKIIIDPLINERDLGLLTNSRRDDGQVAKHQTEQGVSKTAWIPPQGESVYDVQNRAKIFLEKLRDLKEESVLVCSHQIFLRCLEMLILNKPIETAYQDPLPLFENGELRLYEI